MPTNIYRSVSSVGQIPSITLTPSSPTKTARITLCEGVNQSLNGLYATAEAYQNGEKSSLGLLTQTGTFEGRQIIDVVLSMSSFPHVGQFRYTIYTTVPNPNSEGGYIYTTFAKGVVDVQSYSDGVANAGNLVCSAKVL